MRKKHVAFVFLSLVTSFSMMSSNYIHLPSNHMVSFFLMAELNSNIYICLPCYLLCFLFNKIREQEGGTGSAWKPRVGEMWEVAQTMCTHLSKCKNDKNKRNK
jgi:hypothetical protein